MPVRVLLGFCLALLGGGLAAQQLSIDPAFPTPLDLVRLRYMHVGCTNPDSVQVSQAANQITVRADRGPASFPDCGTVIGYFDEYTLGRLPTGEYDAQLIVNPLPGTLGPSLLLGPVHFTVATLPSTGSAHPHENYTDLWWSPRESGWALNVYQSGDTLIAIWAVYDTTGRATWYALLSGNWRRDATSNLLHYSGAVYRTTGPYWAGNYDPSLATVAAVGTADFLPTGTSNAWFSYTIEGIAGLKVIERFRF